MKNITTKPTTDELLHSLIAYLRAKGTRCGTGAEMTAIRAQR